MTLDGQLQDSWLLEIVTFGISFLIARRCDLHSAHPRSRPSAELVVGDYNQCTLDDDVRDRHDIAGISIGNQHQSAEVVHHGRRSVPVIDVQTYDAASRGVWGSLMFVKAMGFYQLPGGRDTFYIANRTSYLIAASFKAPTDIHVITTAKLLGMFIQLAVR